MASHRSSARVVLMKLLIGLLLIPILLFGARAYWVYRGPAEYVCTAELIYHASEEMVEEGSPRKGNAEGVIATALAVLQSHEVQKKAGESVETNHPKLERRAVHLEFENPEGTTMILVSAIGQTSDYLQAYLDALLAEFFAYRKRYHGESANELLHLATEELIRLEKEMDRQQAQIDAFKREQGGALAEAKIEGLKRAISEITKEHALLKDPSAPHGQALSGRMKQLEDQIQEFTQIADALGELEKVRDRQSKEYELQVEQLQGIDRDSQFHQDVFSILRKASPGMLRKKHLLGGG